MGTVVRFIAVFLISLVIAIVAGWVIATHFMLGDAFMGVMFGQLIFALVAIAVFAVTYLVAHAPRAFNWTALGLALLLTVLSLLPDSVGQGTSTFKNPGIFLALVVPGLLLILVQWGQVRRRWLSLREPESLATCWPWVTTVIGAVVVLNPLGLDLLESAIRQSAGDWLRGLSLMIAGSLAAALAIGSVIEYGIRRRAIRARAIEASKALAPESEKWQQVFGDDTSLKR